MHYHLRFLALWIPTYHEVPKWFQSFFCKFKCLARTLKKRGNIICKSKSGMVHSESKPCPPLSPLTVHFTPPKPSSGHSHNLAAPSPCPWPTQLQPVYQERGRQCSWREKSTGRRVIKPPCEGEEQGGQTGSTLGLPTGPFTWAGLAATAAATWASCPATRCAHKGQSGCTANCHLVLFLVPHVKTAEGVQPLPSLGLLCGAQILAK